MITPRFKVIQTDKTVTICIRAPYSNLQELDVYVENEVFLFSSSPYYLRLHLTGKLVENSHSTSSFNADTGEFTFTYEKATENEYFPDLDLITKLLQPSVEVPSSLDGTNINDRKITVLTSSTVSEAPTNTDCDKYGFAMLGGKSIVWSEFREIFEIDPLEVPLEKRRCLRQQYEQGKFNVDHYLSDFIEDDEISELIQLSSPWSDLSADQIQFTDQELDHLKDLPNIQYTLTDEQIQYCLCSLIDILYAYCYDKRTTHFESTIESSWTIIKLAASLSWLDGFKQINDVIVTAYRRSLIHPLYRNYQLNEKVLDDLKVLLDLGEKYLIRCLIDMYRLFLSDSAPRYIINQLFINEYIVYVMQWDRNRWQQIVTTVKAVTIQKHDLGLNLIEIEDYAVTKLDRFRQLRIENNDSDDNSASEDSSSSSSSSSTSSSNGSVKTDITETLVKCNKNVI